MTDQYFHPRPNTADSILLVQEMQEDTRQTFGDPNERIQESFAMPEGETESEDHLAEIHFVGEQEEALDAIRSVERQYQDKRSVLKEDAIRFGVNILLHTAPPQAIDYVKEFDRNRLIPTATHSQVAGEVTPLSRGNEIKAARNRRSRRIPEAI